MNPPVAVSADAAMIDVTVGPVASTVNPFALLVPTLPAPSVWVATAE